MNIQKLELQNFMLFDSFDSDWSPHVNVICGNNNTGKTALLKVLYATTKATSEVRDGTNAAYDAAFSERLRGVFRPDNAKIGRLCGRSQGNKAATSVSVEYDKGIRSEYNFSTRSENHVTLKEVPACGALDRTPVYIPPKEIISATENFGALYDQYHIAFEETYYDLTRLLERPLKKGPNSVEQNTVISKFEDIVGGKVACADRKFFLKVKGEGNFEMGLVSEGYRKLSTLMYLILAGCLDRGSILFWDEPETNLNPRMIKPVCEAIVELANNGVQVFVTTHDYFVQQAFNMVASYPKANKGDISIQFSSLYKEDGVVKHEVASRLSDLEHNLVMEEFDAVYDREQELLDDDN